MKNLFLLLAILSTNSAFANCIGSGTFKTCNDANGNSYTIQKFGNTTNMQGYNANTGSSWHQNSNTIGNTTYINGNASNGNNWNETIQNNGSYRTQSGTDSDGNYFHKTCNQYGCY